MHFELRNYVRTARARPRSQAVRCADHPRKTADTRRKATRRKPLSVATPWDDIAHRAGSQELAPSTPRNEIAYVRCCRRLPPIPGECGNASTLTNTRCAGAMWSRITLSTHIVAFETPDSRYPLFPYFAYQMQQWMQRGMMQRAPFSSKISMTTAARGAGVLHPRPMHMEHGTTCRVPEWSFFCESFSDAQFLESHRSN